MIDDTGMALSIDLPAKYLPVTLESLSTYIHDVSKLLNSPTVSSIIVAHPNALAVEGAPVPVAIHDIWDRLGSIGETYSLPEQENLIEKLVNGIVPNDLHGDLERIIFQILALQLDRSPDPSLVIPDPLLPRGMSPKKAHEVIRLSTLIGRLATRGGISHVVDIGAGQGYLSRELASPILRTESNVLPMAVLALDSNDDQVHGAVRRTEAAAHNVHGNSATITYQSVYISPQTLPPAIDAWLSSSAPTGDLSSNSTYFTLSRSPLPEIPTPVSLTALHACGSLTPSILRSFITMTQSPSPDQRSHIWRPTTIAVVGCCYNLLHNEDFPLSRALSASFPHNFLQVQHLQLAAQVPTMWTSSPTEWARSCLARRKVVYRALLERVWQPSSCNPGHNHDLPRLGRLNDAAYKDWQTFLSRLPPSFLLSSPLADMRFPTKLGFQLESFQVLRCLIGPLIESLIIADRVMYLCENLDEGWVVSAKNAFDQKGKGASARNVVIVVERR